MRMTILPERLAEALAVAKSAVGNGRVVPSLGMVLLDASIDGGVTITGTDLETRAWKQVSARVDAPGAVCLPPANLSEFLTVCPDGAEISLTVNDQYKAELVCGRARARVAGLDPELFPAASDFEGPSADFTLAAPFLAELIESVAHAVAPDRSRETLAGINLQVRDGRLTLTAADGFRLAIRSADVLDVPDLSVIVFGAALEKTTGALEKSTSARLLVNANETALLVDTEAGCWAIQLIEGQFPDFRRIVPREHTTTVTIAREALRKAAQFTQGIESVVIGFKTRLTVSEGLVAVRAATDEGDRAAEMELDADVEGKDLSIAFNCTYLSDALAALPGERVCLKASGADRPGLLVSPDDVQGDHIQIVMPVVVKRP